MTTEQKHAQHSKSKKIELVIQQLNGLPTLPAVAARLLQLTVKSDTQANEVVRLIESDPSLASKIVSLTTKASVGISKNAASLSKAVVMLGFDAVRNAVLSIKVFETLNRTSSEAEGELFDRVGFWKHSLAVACAAKMLIKHIDPKVDAEEAFVCGLLHDIGKLALDTCLPKSFARIVQMTESSMGNIAEVERKILGLDHCVVGRRLGQKWNLPEVITEAVWLHHQWVGGLPEAVQNPGIIQTVHLADVLARQMRIGYSGNHHLDHTAGEVAKELGISAEEIETISRQLPEAISERASMLGLDELEPQGLYHDALGEANSELGRLNEQLRQQNQQLQSRSLYFNLICQLNNSLQIGQSVVDICSQITELWYRHSGCERCATYVTAQDESIIEGAVIDNAEGATSIFLVDHTEDSDLAGNVPLREKLAVGFNVAYVDTNHYWFFEQVCPSMEIDKTIMMPLLVGEQYIGAILWQSDKAASYYQKQLADMGAFAAGAALALQQGQEHEKQSMLSEQMAQSNAELQQVQRELLQKRTLATVGEMACGAAHEINNPLAVIVGRSQLLASNEADEDKKATLQNIAKNGEEISEIITDLLEFSQPSVPEPAKVKVDSLLAQVMRSQSQYARNEHITIETECDEDIPEIFVDSRQVCLALAEILNNAIESYGGEEGSVTLKAHYNELEEEVIIEVADQGCGMSEEVLQKAMDPFFSAKPAGRRRGLGLSRSLRRIEHNGGKLHLESRSGKGSCVRIVLPVVQAPVSDEVTVS